MKMKILIPSMSMGADLWDWAVRQQTSPMPEKLWVSDDLTSEIGINQVPVEVPVLKKEVEVWYQIDTTSLPPNSILVLRTRYRNGVVPQMSGVYKK